MPLPTVQEQSLTTFTFAARLMWLSTTVSTGERGGDPDGDCCGEGRHHCGSGWRPGIRSCRASAPDPAHRRRQGRRRLRLPLRRRRATACSTSGTPWATAPDAALEHAHRSQPDRHGDVLQGRSGRELIQSIPRRTTASASSPRSPPRLAQARARVWEVSISYSGRTYEEGKKIGGATALRPSGTFCDSTCAASRAVRRAAPSGKRPVDLTGGEHRPVQGRRCPARSSHSSAPSPWASPSGPSISSTPIARPGRGPAGRQRRVTAAALGLLRPSTWTKARRRSFCGVSGSFSLCLAAATVPFGCFPSRPGWSAVSLMYPLARRFLDQAEARLAAVIGIFSPLLITYSNAVKQYSVELLVAVVLLLLFERVLRRQLDCAWCRCTRSRSRRALALLVQCVPPLDGLAGLGALPRTDGCGAPTAGARCVGGLGRPSLYRRVPGGPPESVHAPLLGTGLRLAAQAELLAHAWKTVEDLVWGFVAGDPVGRSPPVPVVPPPWERAGGATLSPGIPSRRAHARVDGAAALGSGASDCLRLRGSACSPSLPRLTLFLLPGLILLFVAGLTASSAEPCGRAAAWRSRRP